jgi:hypothetical protein
LQQYGSVVEILSLAARAGRPLEEAERAAVLGTLQGLVNELTGRTDVQVLPSAADRDLVQLVLRMMTIESVIGTEEPTNAGIPSAKATILLGRSGVIRFAGSTPLGTSAGETEAIHYVDSIIVPDAVTARHAALFVPAGDGTLRFKKGTKLAEVEAKGDDDLTALFKKAQRYDGKGCLDAAEHVETVLATAFRGRKVSELGSLANIDARLLELERDRAVSLGMLPAGAGPEEQIHVMQRKGAIGMNAVLSMSLALGRLSAAAQGKELWQLIREQAVETMARFIMANADPATRAGKDFSSLKNMDFDELRRLYRTAAQKVIDSGQTVHTLLRRELPVYHTAGMVQLGERRIDLSEFDEQHRSELRVLEKVFKVRGHVTYDAKIRNEEGEERVFVHVDSRGGVGERYQSNQAAVDGYFPSSSHKTKTILGKRGDLGVYVDRITGRGHAVEGLYYVAVPSKQSPMEGTITALIGEFDESYDKTEKPKQMRGKFNAMISFLEDRRVQVNDALRAEVRVAFESIPWSDLFTLSKQELFIMHFSRFVPITG